MYAWWKTPESYRHCPDGEKLPEKVKVWRVQQTNKMPGGASRPSGAVSRSWGFEDSPDAEVLAVGYNTSKENGAVAVGRHGNFLQWGFSAPPSRMTEAGRKFFLNCICYIVKFNGKAPLVRRKSQGRFTAIWYAMFMKRTTERPIYSGIFSPDLMDKYEDDWKGMLKYFQDDYELICCDRDYRIDTELKSLGIKSNRELETLERLIALLEDEKRSEVARKLLGRYTTESLETQGEWQEWLANSRDRIYFSDFGGFKFRVVPEGYLDGKGGIPAKMRP